MLDFENRKRKIPIYLSHSFRDIKYFINFNMQISKYPEISTENFLNVLLQNLMRMEHYEICIIIIIEYSVQGRSFVANSGTKVTVLLKGKSSTANAGT